MHYVEKPESFVSDDISCGVYLLSPAVFDDIRPVFLRNHSNGAFIDEISFERDVIPVLCSEGRLFAFTSTSFWSQVKTAGSAVYANRHYLYSYRARQPELLSSLPCVTGDVYIDPAATIDPSAKIGPNVTIGPGVTVGPGARIKDSIVLDRVHLAAHCCVINSIIGWDTTVGTWARVEGNAVGVNPNDPTTHEATQPLFSADGRLAPTITVVGEGCHIADEVLVRHSIVLPHKDIRASHRNEIIL